MSEVKDRILNSLKILGGSGEPVRPINVNFIKTAMNQYSNTVLKSLEGNVWALEKQYNGEENEKEVYKKAIEDVIEAINKEKRPS